LTEDELRAVHALLFGLAIRISDGQGGVMRRDCRDRKLPAWLWEVVTLCDRGSGWVGLERWALKVKAALRAALQKSGGGFEKFRRDLECGADAAFTFAAMPIEFPE
jgi:hypothetical protein